MRVGVDDVANRFIRPGLNRASKCCTHLRTAAGVDDRDATLAHDEPDVGDIAQIPGGHRLDAALMNKHAGDDLGQLECARLDGHDL